MLQRQALAKQTVHLTFWIGGGLIRVNIYQSGQSFRDYDMGGRYKLFL